MTVQHAQPHPSRPKSSGPIIFGDEVVDDRHLHHAGQQAKDKTLDLNILMAHEEGKAHQK
jgi:hypothetical protein